MKGIFLFFILSISSSVYAAGDQWVYGKVDQIRDYGSGSGNAYQVTVTLKDVAWQGTGDGASVCAVNGSYRFRIVVGANGVTEASQQRIYSMLLAAYMSGKKVGLYIFTLADPECSVDIAQIGDNF